MLEKFAPGVVLALVCVGCGSTYRERVLDTFPIGGMQRERLLKFCDLYERLQCLAHKTSGEYEEDMAKFRKEFDESFDCWRVSPLNPTVQSAVFNVVDFGAKGDGKSCNCEAFARAFDAVRSLGGKPSVLRVPMGCYLFTRQMDGGGYSWSPAHVNFNAITNCLLTGVSPETTRFVFCDPDVNGIVLVKSCNVTLSNVDIRWRDCPFSQGVIEDVDLTADPHALTIRHEPGTKRPDDPHYRQARNPQVCGLFDANGHQHLGQPIFYDTHDPIPAEDLGGGRYRIKLDKRHSQAYGAGRVCRGMTVVLPDRQGGSAVVARYSSHCAFDSVWVRNSPSAGFVTCGSADVTAWRVRVFPARPEFRLSTNADAIFNAPGTFIAHCEFRNMNDDGANCHYKGSVLREVVGNRILHFKECGLGVLRRGDPICIYKAKTSELVARLHIESVRLYQEGDGWSWEVGTKEGIPVGVTSQKDIGGGELTAAERQSLSHGVGNKPKEFADIVYAPYGHGLGYVVTDTEMGDFRGIAINAQCSHVLVESNRFDNCNNGVQLSSLMNWYEGIPGRNFWIRGNRMCTLMRGVDAYVHGVLGTVQGEFLDDILVENNEFENVERPLRFGNARNVCERYNNVHEISHERCK